MRDDQTAALLSKYPRMVQRADELPLYDRAIRPLKVPTKEQAAVIRCLRQEGHPHVLAVVTRRIRHSDARRLDEEGICEDEPATDGGAPPCCQGEADQQRELDDEQRVLVTEGRSWKLPDTVDGVPAFCPKCPIQEAEWVVDPVAIRRLLKANRKRPLGIDVAQVGRRLPDIARDLRQKP